MDSFVGRHLPMTQNKSGSEAMQEAERGDGLHLGERSEGGRREAQIRVL